MRSQDQESFGRIVMAMRPYLDQLVIVGAWCHRLLQFHPLARPLPHEPLMTEDADVATPDRLPRRPVSLDEALTAGGFSAQLSGEGKLPVTKYVPNGDENGLCIEFVSALRGAELTRKGEPNDILAVSGVTAQRLRHVDLLLTEPWELALSAQAGFSVELTSLSVRLASPASYLAQKVLTLRRRPTATKRAKDALYIHDTLTMFGGSFAKLRQPAARVLDRLAPRTRRDFDTLRVALFEDQAIVTAAGQIASATGRANPPSADTIATVCTRGLELLFAA